jgi:hypothetical protein
MPRLLICGALSRPDILGILARSVGRFEMVFIEYAYNEGTGIDKTVYEPFGEVLTWEQFRSADALLDQVRPDRVVLFYTTSLNQVALRQAALDRDINVLHLEHGIPLPVVSRMSATASVPRLRNSDWRTHAFFLRSLPRRRPRVQRLLIKYAVAVQRHGPTSEILQRFATIRRADRYVSFSRECIAYHVDMDRIADPPQVVSITGAPQFDDFRLADPPSRLRPAALLIDHQLHNAGWCGWTLAYRDPWVRGIASAVKAAGYELYVKTHPGDRSNAWDSFAAAGEVKLVSRSDVADLANEVPFVLGTFSTLQSALAAMPQVAHVTLEIHPDSRWFPSRRLVEMGIAEPVTDFGGLEMALRRYDELQLRQAPHKPEFIKQFLYALDGQAGQRVSDALGSGR